MFNNKTPVTIEPPAPAMPVSGVPGGPGGYGESEVHLLDRLSVLYRYRNIVIAVVIVVLIGGAVQTYTTTKEYKAVAVVQIDPDRPSIQGIAQGMFSPDDDMYAFETELTNLRSHTLALRVARKLNLANNPEYNGEEAQPTGLGDALLSLRSRLLTPILSLFRGAPAKTAAPVAAKESTTAAAPGADLNETPEEAARVDLLLSRQAVNRRIGTRQVDIEVTSRHPKFAADAANAFADEYVASNFERKTAAIETKKTQYDKQKTRLEVQVATELKLFQEASQKTPAGAYIDPGALASTVSSARNLLTQAQDRTAIAKAEADRLAKVNLKDNDAALEAAKTVPGLSTDSVVVGYLNSIEDLEKSKKRMMAEQGFGVGHPRIIAVDTDIASVRKQLTARLQSLVDTTRLNLEVAKNSEDRFRIAFETTDHTSQDQANQGISLSIFQNKIKQDQDLLDKTTQQAEEAGVEASATSNNVRKSDAAQIPTSPFKPDPARNMLMALLAGLVLALGLAFGLDYLDDTVKTPEDITRKLHVPFLGLVPAVRGDKQPVLSGPVPHDFGESYRALRTSLVFTSGGESTRVITVTSAQPLEGKTTTACNLAMVLAFGGSRVLLMDADMRRPGVHKALKINNTVGLSHLLVGQARVREAIQRTSDPNFCVMTAGRTPPNPSELLSSERMRQLIANLKQGPFDWVVIDTPPVLAVTDAVILTPLVDGVTFVVGAEMTRRRLAERAVHMIMASRPKVVGAVLNRVNFDRNKYYYSRYYGYQYKSYYGTHTSGSTSTASPKA
jgi:polysaccharide biosynthesis transport protein